MPVLHVSAFGSSCLSLTQNRLQIALSRPSLSRYSPSSFKGAPDGDHAATGFGSSVQHRQIHTSEGLLNRIKPRMEHRQSIDSNTRSCRPPGSPASPKSSTREQLAAALEKAVKACAAENPHSEASPSAKVRGQLSFLLCYIIQHSDACPHAEYICIEGSQPVLEVQSGFSGRFSAMDQRECGANNSGY